MRLFSSKKNVRLFKRDMDQLIDRIQTKAKAFKKRNCFVDVKYIVKSMSSRGVLPSQVKKGEVTIKLFTPLAPQPHHVASPSPTKNKQFPMKYTDAELKARLTPEQYTVTQKAGTEKAFTGQYWDHFADGTYKCIVCKEELFDSKTKFDSGCGWPSFYDVLENGKVKLVKDNTAFMQRTEVLCAQCGAHLGHVFDDGPKPTGNRYCMNSCSLDFKDAADKDA